MSFNKNSVAVATLLATLLSARSFGAECFLGSLFDEVDLSEGNSSDCNENRLPDECDLLPRLASGIPVDALRGRNAIAVAAVDLDGEPGLEIVTANQDSRNLSVLKADTLGAYLLEASHHLGFTPGALLHGDLDEDGDQDLVASSSSSEALMALINNGSGKLERSHISNSGTVDRVLLADLDGDRLPDLVGSARGASDLQVLWNSGDAAFESSRRVLVEGMVRSVDTLDLDGDGLLDIAVVHAVQVNRVEFQRLSVHRNTGGREFAPIVSIQLFPSSTDRIGGMDAGDFDGDGGIDLALSPDGRTTLHLVWSDGPGTLGTLQALPTLAVPGGVVAKDLDGDSDLDLVLHGFRSSVLWNLGGRRFEEVRLPLEDVVDLAVTDLDGDGSLDMVGVGDDFRREISLLRKNSGGSFQLAASVALEPLGRAITSGDYDGDGRRDLAVMTVGPPRALVLPQDEEGRFTGLLAAPLDSDPTYAKSGDFDGDGDLDLAVTHGEASRVTFLDNRGEGLFSPGSSIALEYRPFSITAGDLDEDGDVDLALTSQTTFLCSFLWNEGLAGMLEGEPVRTEFRPYQVDAIDVDEDGDLDLLLGSQSSMRMLTNAGGRRFDVGEPFGVPDPSISVDHGDFDGDGLQDLAFAQGRREIALVRARDISAFPTKWVHQMASFNASRLTVGDFTGDGRPEVAVLNVDLGTAEILVRTSEASSLDRDGNSVPDECDVRTNDCNHNEVDDRDEVTSGQALDCNENGVPDECDLRPNLEFAAPIQLQAGIAPYGLVSADWNGDGALDLAMTDSRVDSLTVFLNQDDSSFTKMTYPVKVTVPNHSFSVAPRGVAATDLDGDGKQDLAIANAVPLPFPPRSGSVSLFHNQGAGSFTGDPEGRFLITGGTPESIVAGDLDADGDMDLATGHSTGSSNISIQWNDSHGGFPTRTDLAAQPWARSLLLEDLDRDGRHDLIAIGSSIGLFFSRGNGEFDPASQIVLTEATYAAVVSDLDGDGDADLAEAQSSLRRINIHWNDGTRTFRSSRSPLLRVAKPHALAAVDQDGDYLPELAVSSNASPRALHVFPSLGQEAFGWPRTTSFGFVTPDKSLLAMTTGDFDGNGLPDLALSIGEGDERFPGALTILRTLPAADGDCNQTGAPDSCDIIRGDSVDVDLDGLPDECDSDCNGNGFPDDHDISAGASPDCNRNEIPDECDLSSGASPDRNGNGIPDECDPRPAFRRADANADGDLDISDGLCPLQFLFLGGPPPPCLEAADANNDGALDCTDAVFTLSFVFLGGPPPPAPGPPPGPCGSDPDPRGSPADLGCESYARC